MSPTGRTHFLASDKVHYTWNNRLPPALEVSSGDTVVFDLREVTDNQITPHSTADDLTRLDWSRIYPLGGPVFVKGVRPGDTLEVEILDLHPKGWGWTGIIPGFGLLDQEFTTPYLRIWDLSASDHTTLHENIRIPLDPFCGTMGVAPAEPGEIPVMPRGSSAATWTSATSPGGRGCCCPCRWRGSCSPAGTAMPPRGTARCA